MSNTTLINPDLPANRIVGVAACPNCVVRSGDPNEERRDNLGNDRRVSCVFCRRISTQVLPGAADIYRQPQMIRDLVADLISTGDTLEGTFSLTAVTSGEGYGAVAHGLGPDDILTTVILVSGEVKLEISYTGNNVKSAEKPGVMIGQDYDPLVSRLPEEADQAAQKLMSADFTLVNYDIGGRRPSLTFVRGTQILDEDQPRRVKANIGVRATISWTV